jgi:GGDEF domain-containing protein
VNGLAAQIKIALPLEPRPGAMGAWECRLPENILSWTDGVYDIFGLRRGSTIHRSDTLDLYEDRSRTEMNRLRSQAIATGRPFSLDCRIRSNDGKRRWMRLIVGVENAHGRPMRIFGSKQDVTAEKGFWADLAGTCEPGAIAAGSLRSGFEEALARFAERSGGLDCALVIYAVDDYPRLLATYGAAACEGLLEHLGQRLSRLFPDALASGSLANGAFAVLYPTSNDPERLVATLESARRLLRRPVSRGAFTIEFAVSAGAATGSSTGRPASEPRLMASAEAGLKAARMTGGDKLRLFDRPLTGSPVFGAPVPAARLS